MPRAPWSVRGFTLVECLFVLAVIAILAALLYPVLMRARLRSYNAACVSNLRQIYLAGIGYMADSDDRFPPVRINWAIGGSFAATLDRDVQEAAERANPRSLQNMLYPYTRTRAVFRCAADTGACLPQDMAQDMAQDGYPSAAYAAAAHLAGPFHATASREGIPLYERFGTSYRAAGELGEPERDLSLADVPEPMRVFFAADTSGYWHPGADPRLFCEEEDPARSARDRQWSLNAVFLDGHTRRVGFQDAIWGPYMQLLGGHHPG